MKTIPHDRFVPHVFAIGDKLGTFIHRLGDVVIAKRFREQDLIEIKRAATHGQEIS